MIVAQGGTEWSAVWLSLQIATIAACACVLLSLPLGYWLARTESRFRWLIETIATLPLVLPPVVTGFFLLVLFSPTGWVGSCLEQWFGIKIVLTWWAALIAATVVSFPLALRPIQQAFRQTDRRLEWAARTLGANRRSTFLAVTLPLARPGIIAAWLLAFARSLGEFGATIMVAGNIVNKTRTIPLAVYSQVNSADGIRQAWPLVMISVLLACMAIGVGQLLEQRSGDRHE